MEVLDAKLDELRQNPNMWLSFDTETRHLLKHLADNGGTRLRQYDPSVHGCPSIME